MNARREYRLGSLEELGREVLQVSCAREDRSCADSLSHRFSAGEARSSAAPMDCRDGKRSRPDIVGLSVTFNPFPVDSFDVSSAANEPEQNDSTFNFDEI